MPRILYRDLIPYETPSSLSALRGPSEGMLELPITVHWGPKHVYDLSNVSDLESAYQALVREGTPEAQEDLLNEALLRKVWSDLVLPTRCLAVWVTQFPDLVA